MIHHDIGPNLGSTANDFFQTDASLKLAALRQEKDDRFGHLGNPVNVGGKVLHFELVKNADSTVAYVAESSHVARKVDMATGKTLCVFRGHKGPITKVLIHDNVLFTASWDKTIKKWNAETGQLLGTMSGHRDFVKSVCVSGQKLYSASTDKLIGEWDLQTCKLLRTFAGHRRSVEDVAATPDGLFLFSASSDNSIQKWDIALGKSIETFEAHDTSVRRLFLLPESDCLWSVSADKTARRWDLESKQVDLKFSHPDYVVAIATLPNGHIATGCRDENIRIWDPSLEKCIKVIKGHFGEVSHLASGAGGTLWSGSLDSTIRTWDLTNPELGQDPDPNDHVQETFVPMTKEEEEALEELMK